MNSRKLISFGSSSYVISLPKSWVCQNKLSKGALIFVKEKGDELVLSLDDRELLRELKEKKIDSSNKSIKYLETEIVSSYLNHYDIIEVRNFKEEDALRIKEILQNLAGLEIMEQTSTKIIAKDLINLKEVSIRTLLRRIDIIIRSILDDVLLTIDKESVENIYQRDMDVNRLTLLVRRIISAALEDPRLTRLFGVTQLELVSQWEIADRLEKTGDQAKRIARSLIKTPLSKEQRQAIEIMFEELKKKYLSVMKAYYQKDFQTAYDIEANADTFMVKCNKAVLIPKRDILKNLTEEDAKKLFIIDENLKRMMTAIRNIARAVISTAN